MPDDVAPKKHGVILNEDNVRKENGNHPYPAFTPDIFRAAQIRVQAMDAIISKRPLARIDTAYDVCLNAIAKEVALHGAEAALACFAMKKLRAFGQYVFGTADNLTKGE